MTFVFEGQEYPFDIRYLGCVPLAQCKDESVATQAVELLFHKLDSIQVCGSEHHHQLIIIACPHGPKTPLNSAPRPLQLIVSCCTFTDAL